MTFTQVRDAVVYALEKHIGRPVVLSEQIADRPEFPYSYYSVLSPRASDHAFGFNEAVKSENGFILQRTERVSATMSFTFCSINRETNTGFVFGEDEASELSEKAHSFFLLSGHNISTEYGDIVVNNVGASASRSSFFVEDTIRRYGFDVRFSYMRTDEMPTEIISKVNPVGQPY